MREYFFDVKTLPEMSGFLLNVSDAETTDVIFLVAVFQHLDSL